MTTGAGRFRTKIPRSSVLEPAESINLRQLYGLMKEYTERLTEQTALLNRRRHTISLRSENDEGNVQDLAHDVDYLANRTIRLVDKASAYRETAEISEIDQLELELYLFDAENALRTAKKALDRIGIKLKV